MRRFPFVQCYGIAALIVVLVTSVLPTWAVTASDEAAAFTSAAEVATPLGGGYVTVRSNLRASPSLEAEIVAILNQGTAVEILLEAERWYHVRTAQGLEAWIAKSLVRLDDENRPDLSRHAATTMPFDIQPNPATSTVYQDIVGWAQAQEPSGQHAVADTATLSPGEDPGDPSRGTWMVRLKELVPFWGQVGVFSVCMVLVAGLVVAVVLQLRAAKQLRRAVRHMSQIVDLVEGLLTGEGLPVAHASLASPVPVVVEALALPTRQEVSDFSPAAQAALALLSEQPEVLEEELEKALHEGGFSALPIKAIIGEIIAKTGTVGLPWVQVQCSQGRYWYQLRSHALMSLDVGQASSP